MLSLMLPSARTARALFAAVRLKCVPRPLPSDGGFPVTWRGPFTVTVFGRSRVTGGNQVTERGYKFLAESSTKNPH